MINIADALLSAMMGVSVVAVVIAFGSDGYIPFSKHRRENIEGSRTEDTLAVAILIIVALSVIAAAVKEPVDKEQRCRCPHPTGSTRFNRVKGE